MSARPPGRRRFLIVLGAAVAALAIGLRAWRWGRRGPWERWGRGQPWRSGPAARQAEAAGRIASALSYLRLSQEDIVRFLEDHERALGPARTDAAALPDLCGKFLLSTDFFTNGADETRSICYVTLYDPYHSPCVNPLTKGLEAPGDP